MKTYIALLRGINVSGHKIIKMETLRKAMDELPFTDVSTYIQSGNIIFKSDLSDRKAIGKMISALIWKHFGFDVPVLVVDLKELRTIVENQPQGRKITDPAQPYVAFLDDIPASADIEKLKLVNFGNDEFVHESKVLYLFYADGAAKTKLSNAIIETKLKVKSTARNWKTIHKLIELAENS